ncbi:hypothetical protein BXA50_13810 [Enterococcus faecium]|nr:hypothetical protein BXA50_13810 [Enterococcus faecium]
MKYILCQPAINRFKWELEVCLTNLKKLGIKDIVLLFRALCQMMLVKRNLRIIGDQVDQFLLIFFS